MGGTFFFFFLIKVWVGGNLESFIEGCNAIVNFLVKGTIIIT